MATNAQIEANRENSQKSTGPKTAEGKAAVAKNAVKHGLFAHESVIPGENPEDFEFFREELLAELAPVGVVESLLAERVVGLSWRLQRAERMQNQVIEDMIARQVTNPQAIKNRETDCYQQGIFQEDPRFGVERWPLARIAVSDWSGRAVLDRMLMYERRIENSLLKMMRELKRHQIMRRVERQGVHDQRPAEKRRNLKKQSQLLADEMTLSDFREKAYESQARRSPAENKANSPAFGRKSEACQEPSPSSA